MTDRLTNRLTDGDGKAQAETAGIRDFAQFNVRDSFSVPATDSPIAGGAPVNDSQSPQRVSKNNWRRLTAAWGSATDSCSPRCNSTAIL